MRTIFFKICVMLIVGHLLFSCSSFKEETLDSAGKQIVLKLAPGENNPRNSEGDFIKLKDGRILFIYTHFTDGAGDHAKAFLAARSSENGGKTWSQKDQIIVQNEGDFNIMSVSLLRLQDGRIGLFYLRKNSHTDCIPVMRISTDEAQSWSRPVECIKEPGYYVMNNDRVVQLKSGRVLLPVSLHRTPETERSDRGTILCYYSDDGANTWTRGQIAENPELVMTQEPGVVELKDGTVYMFCRTDAGTQYDCFSTDGGKSWSPLKASNIKSPRSPASIERIPSTGDLLMLWNNNYKPVGDGQRRTPFNVAISQDEGKTWENTKQVESDFNGWYCYTAIFFEKDYVILGHSAGNRKKNNGLATEHITLLSNKWIYKNPLPNPYVKSDKNGQVELACDIKDVKIKYTLDGTVPTENSNLYETSLTVTKTTSLIYRAYKAGEIPSDIVFDTVGKDVLQQSRNVKDARPGVFYGYYDGEFTKVSDFENNMPKHHGIGSRFSLEQSTAEENFALSFECYLKVPQDGIYTFYLNSNDGSLLSLNDEIFIDNDGAHGDNEIAATTALKNGYHKLKLLYFQQGGGKALKVSWKGPNFEKREIPEDVLFVDLK